MSDDLIERLGKDDDASIRMEAADRISELEAERDNLRSIIHALLNCPHIADRDPPPWHEPETEAAVSRAFTALANKENDHD